MSGGDPADILTLTHAQLVDFHRRFYHPRNALFYTYGRVPLEPVLATVDAVLRRRLDELGPADAAWTPPDVGQLQRFPQPRRATVTCPPEPRTLCYFTRVDMNAGLTGRAWAWTWQWATRTDKPRRRWRT